MTKVNINGSNHQVEVDHDGGDLTYVVEKAQKLWNDTKPSDRPGPAYGFTAEREQRAGGFAWNMGEGDQPAVKS